MTALEQILLGSIFVNAGALVISMAIAGNLLIWRWIFEQWKEWRRK
jgi:hypothetical protein